MQGATPASLLPDFDGNKSCILSGYIISVRTTKMNLRCPDLTLLQRASFEKTAWKERKRSGPHGASPLHGSPEPALPDPSVTPRRPCRVSSRTSCLQTLAESGGPVGTRTSGSLGTQAAGGVVPDEPSRPCVPRGRGAHPPPRAPGTRSDPASHRQSQARGEPRDAAPGVCGEHSSLCPVG